MHKFSWFGLKLTESLAFGQCMHRNSLSLNSQAIRPFGRSFDVIDIDQKKETLRNWQKESSDLCKPAE